MNKTERRPQKARIIWNILNTEIIDWFGKDVKFSDETDDEVTAEVRVSRMAIKFWAMQYGEHITVLSPESLVDEIKNALQKAEEKYGN